MVLPSLSSAHFDRRQGPVSRSGRAANYVVSSCEVDRGLCKSSVSELSAGEGQWRSSVGIDARACLRECSEAWLSTLVSKVPAHRAKTL